jgi:acyl-CoA reductase-like NAD-dependent aldehyde dehydrogenase
VARFANDTRYGLSAVVFGKDLQRCERVVCQIDAGRVLINTLAHEPRAPFGGFKHSGLGREMGKWGISLPGTQNAADGIGAGSIAHATDGAGLPRKRGQVHLHTA